VTCRFVEQNDVSWNGFRDMDAENEHPGIFEIWVQSADMVLASDIRQRLGMEAEEMPAVTDFVEGCCPACGYSLPEEPVDECPDCGLSLGGQDDDEPESIDLDLPAQGTSWLPRNPGE